MLNSVRDEMLKTIYATHLYLERLVQEAPDGDLLQETEELLEALWYEYSRRDERARLQLDDLTFTARCLPADHPRTPVFSLRPYNLAGEQNWALLENIALLEAMYSRNHQPDRSQQDAHNDQPRKRRRMAGSPNRLHLKLLSGDSSVQLTALQLLPFLSKEKELTLDEIKESMADLMKCITAKQGTVASWAMLACSR